MPSQPLFTIPTPSSLGFISFLNGVPGSPDLLRPNRYRTGYIDVFYLRGFAAVPRAVRSSLRVEVDCVSHSGKPAAAHFFDKADNLIPITTVVKPYPLSFEKNIEEAVCEPDWSRSPAYIPSGETVLDAEKELASFDQNLNSAPRSSR